MSSNNWLEGPLGLARRAGCLAWGARAVEQAIKRGQAYVVVVARDASGRTRSKVERMSEEDGVPIIYAESSDEMGRWTGVGRIATCAITDPSLARSLIAKTRPSTRR